MPDEMVASWGNVIRARHEVITVSSRLQGFPPLPRQGKVLPYGNGRSYGDSCLNTGGLLLRTRPMDRFISFDAATGVLACEAGILLSEILDVVVPAGWLVPVSPGTRFVTLGGAIANDVHGKNQHGAGTFGRHVRRLQLARSDGEVLVCSPTENAAMFAATAGGLGLTGLILAAELQLKRIPGPFLDVETIRFHNLDEFMALCLESDESYEYTVAWIDCLGSGRQLGRGLFQRARHSDTAVGPARRSQPLTLPFTPPFSLMNSASLRIFNTLYYRRQLGGRRTRCERYESFFYPLDAILHWNRLYGPRGFYQYQSVVPPGSTGRDATAEMLRAIARSGMGACLAVLKMFGAVPSPGMLSFPREGLTLALDFPNRGAHLTRLFATLDAIMEEAGGRLYPAKDGRMPGRLFREGYPCWQEFSRYIDPRASSSFWRRVMEDA
jgi:FAD/FMN-containing dehydrogenase